MKDKLLWRALSVGEGKKMLCVNYDTAGDEVTTEMTSNKKVLYE